MMLKLFAWIEIVLSVFFVCLSLRILSGPLCIMSDVAKTSEHLSITVGSHKESYEEFMKNIFNMRESWNDLGEKTENSARVFQKSGAAIKNFHFPLTKSRPLEGPGKSLEETGDSIANVGKAIQAQADWLEKYEKEKYPQIQASFDRVSANLKKSADETKRLASEQGAVALIIMIVGLLFLLNGIAFLQISKRLNPELYLKKD